MGQSQTAGRRGLVKTAALLAGALLVLSFTDGSAQAQDSVTARLIKPMPQGFPVDVETYDDSDFNLKLQSEMSNALKARGHLVLEGDAPLELLLDPQVVAGSYSFDGKNYSTYEDKSSGAGLDRSIVNKSLQSEGRASSNVLTDNSQNRPDVYEPVASLEALLRDREKGLVLWEGTAKRTMRRDDDPEDAWMALVPLLADIYGENKRR
ncbi:hypothetical protein ACTL6U_04355 [Rhodovibrionaceae bacterium A322]